MDGVSLELLAGEVLGIASVEGNGQRELMRAVAGLVAHLGLVAVGGRGTKVVLARESSRRPALLIAENPTRGLDVHATAEVHARILTAAREGGVSVLFHSTDLDEVLALADRVGVMVEGKWFDVPAAATREEVGALMLRGRAA